MQRVHDQFLGTRAAQVGLHDDGPKSMTPMQGTRLVLGLVKRLKPLQHGRHLWRQPQGYLFVRWPMAL